MSNYFPNLFPQSYNSLPFAYIPTPTATQPPNSSTNPIGTLGRPSIIPGFYSNGKIQIPRPTQETTYIYPYKKRSFLHTSILYDTDEIVYANIRKMIHFKFSLWNIFSKDNPTYPIDVAFDLKRYNIALKILMANPTMSHAIIQCAQRIDILFTATKNIKEGMELFFQKCFPDILLKMSENGSSLLHKAVSHNNADVVKTIVSKCPTLLSVKNKKGNTPILTLMNKLNTSCGRDLLPKFITLLSHINDLDLLLTKNNKGQNVFFLTETQSTPKFQYELNKKINYLRFKDDNLHDTPLPKKIYFYCLFGLDDKVKDLIEAEFSLQPTLPFYITSGFFTFLAQKHFQVALIVFSHIMNPQGTVPHTPLEEFHEIDIAPINTITDPLAKSVMLLAVFGQEDKIPSILDGIDVFEVRKIFTNPQNGLDFLIEFHPHAAMIIFSHMLSIMDPKHLTLDFFLHSLQLAVQTNQSILMFSLLNTIPDHHWNLFIKEKPQIAFDLINNCEDKFTDLCFAKCLLENIQDLFNNEQAPLLISLLENQKPSTANSLLKRILETDTPFNITTEIYDWLSSYLEETGNHLIKEILIKIKEDSLEKSIFSYQELEGNSPLLPDACSSPSTPTDVFLASNPETSNDSSPTINTSWHEEKDEMIRFGSEIDYV